MQATTGLDLRLAFDVRLHGPCMRCLTDAVVDVSIDAREYHANEPGEAVELRSEYVVDDQLELSAGRVTRSRWHCRTRSSTHRTAPASARSAART